MTLPCPVPAGPRTPPPRPPPVHVRRISADIPALAQSIHGHPLVYLDNAATTQKPRAVLDRIRRFYESENANVHRGVHALSDRATTAYEGARERARRFLNAPVACEIVFVRGATEAINLVAASFGGSCVGPGDEVVISTLEHHSNIVPWQMLCEAKGARLRVIPVTDEGDLRLDEYEKMLSPRTRIVAVTHVSNALGTVNPVKEMIATAHAREIPVLLDGAQAAPHMAVDVQALGCDFYAFSGHKVYGPTGIGVLYGRAGLLEKMPPWQGGGDMISSVTFEKTTYNRLPYKFEAGTPHIEGAAGLAAALDYLESVGRPGIEAHERAILAHAVERLSAVEGLRILGRPKVRAGAVSFVLDGVHPHDVGTILDREGIAIRAGHHCAQPVMDRFGVPASVRASFAFYNTLDEVDALAAGLKKARAMFV